MAFFVFLCTLSSSKEKRKKKNHKREEIVKQTAAATQRRSKERARKEDRTEDVVEDETYSCRRSERWLAVAPSSEAERFKTKRESNQEGLRSEAAESEEQTCHCLRSVAGREGNDDDDDNGCGSGSERREKHRRF